MIIDELKYKAIKQDLLNVMNSLAVVCSEFISIEKTQKAENVAYSKKGNLIIVDFTAKKDE